MAHEFEPGVVRRTDMLETVELDAIRDDAPVRLTGIAGRVRHLVRDQAPVVRHGHLGRAAVAVLVFEHIPVHGLHRDDVPREVRPCAGSGDEYAVVPEPDVAPGVHDFVGGGVDELIGL